MSNGSLPAPHRQLVRNVILEIDVEEVKNDMMRRGAIESAIGFTPPEALKDYYVGAIAEIKDM